jgi:hypothetical protein
MANSFECSYLGDFHSLNTITLYQLHEIGFFNWDSELFNWSEYAYNEETYKRLCDMIYNRYKWREICITPPLEWRDWFMSGIKYELCPKFNRLYKLREDMDGLDYTLDHDRYGKRRDIDSEFPETLMSGNSDYASSGKDSEYEDIDLRNPIDDYEKRLAIAKMDIDNEFVGELETYFNSILTTYGGAW